MTQPDNAPVQMPPMTEVERLREELHLFKTAGIIEIAVRNPNVSSWLIEWENRAIKAEEAARSAYAEGKRAGMERAMEIIKRRQEESDELRNGTSPDAWHFIDDIRAAKETKE